MIILDAHGHPIPNARYRVYRKSKTFSDVPVWTVSAPGYLSTRIVSFFPDKETVKLLIDYRHAGGPILEAACTLNLWAKIATVPGLDEDWFRQVIEARQDRTYFAVDPELVQRIAANEEFSPQPGGLHHPPDGHGEFKGFASFKTADEPTLQLTFMTDGHDRWICDADIDEEAPGIRHLGRVIKHAVTGGRTHPYFVQQLLLCCGIDPGYRVVPRRAA